MALTWTITRNHIDGDGREVCNVGNIESFPYAFKVYDDDGELYFEGRSMSNDDEDAFAPLDWAEGNYGATRIDYLQPNGTWETL